MRRCAKCVRKTVPSMVYIHAKDSQQIIGEATIQVCLECCHVTGTVSNASLFNPSGDLPFEAGPDDFSQTARVTLEELMTACAEAARREEREACAKIADTASSDPEIPLACKRLS